MVKEMKGTMTTLKSLQIRPGFNAMLSGAAAFTLVELLVVIAIIAVLASLSVGPIKNAMTNAQRIG